MFPVYAFSPFSLHKSASGESVPNWLREKGSLDFISVEDVCKIRIFH